MMEHFACKKNNLWLCPVRSVLIVALILSLASETYAQLNLDYGPKIGPNVSRFIGNLPFSGMKKPRIGFSAGAFFNLRGTKQKFFQFEGNVFLTSRGNKSEYTNDTNIIRKISPDQEEKKYSILYLEVSPVFKFMLDLRPGTRPRPFILISPTYAGILSASFVGNGREFDSDKTKSSITRDDFGLTIGGGVSWFFLDRWYFLDVRYYQSFRNVSDRMNMNLDPYDENLVYDVKKSRVELYKDDSIIFHSTISATFGISLARQIKSFQ